LEPYEEVLYAPGGAGAIYGVAPREWGDAVRLQDLRLRDCSRVTPAFLKSLAASPTVLHDLTHLDLGNMQALRDEVSLPDTLGALSRIAKACGHSLQVRIGASLSCLWPKVYLLGGIRPTVCCSLGPPPPLFFSFSSLSSLFTPPPTTTHTHTPLQDSSSAPSLKREFPLQDSAIHTGKTV
jgi:hypothetical protein